jgi:uncharacterized protein YecE (DUF72 family)
MPMLIGTSGWSYNEATEKGGWVGSFYPNKSIKKLPYYSKHFDTAEFDAIYYDKFYKNMGAKTFEGMVNSTPPGFRFSLKVPETITRFKKLSAEAMPLFEEYLDRIQPLKKAGKLGVILFQMSPSFTVEDFSNAEKFLDKLPNEYDYALEFRHESWQTEGAPDLLKHYNIASVMTDSGNPGLSFLAEPIVTADHAFIRFHGRKPGHWYNYLYSIQELLPWVDKVNDIEKKTRMLYIYFNNHYSGKAIVNAFQFKELSTGSLNAKEKEALSRAEAHLAKPAMGLRKWL